MMKKLLLAGTAGFALTIAAPAQAAITFCPAGDGTTTATSCISIDVMDPTVGNAFSESLNGSSAVGSESTLFFQANLGVTSLNGSTNYANFLASGGNYFTFAASFNEEITANDGSGSLQFGVPTSAGADPTFGTFNIYAQTSEANNLTGICFVNCGAGSTLILSGSFINDSATFFGNFSANLDAGAAELLDQSSNGDQWSGQTTISGTGGFRGHILITSALASFFPGLSIGDALLFATTLQTLPFEQVDPSKCFSTNAVTSCNFDSFAALSGGINGLTTTGTILQTDANLSFVTTSEIPEPATLMLFGFGLVGSVAVRRMRQRKQKN
jgi:PEP-CTERM motif